MKSATLVLIILVALATTLACEIPNRAPPTQPPRALSNTATGTLQPVATQRPNTESPQPDLPTVHAPQPTTDAPPSLPTAIPPTAAATLLPQEPPPAPQLLPQTTATPIPLPTPQQTHRTPETAPTATVSATDPVPTDIAAVSVYNNLSAAEKECLGPEITNDQSLVESSSHLDADAGDLVSCLSEESLFWLYYIKAEPEAGLQESTHRCIWGAFRQMDSLSNPDHADADIETFAKVMSLMLLAPLYCVQTHEPDTVAAPDTDMNQEQIQSLACHVDEAGGIIEWVNLLFTEDGSYEAATAAYEERCGPIE